MQSTRKSFVSLASAVVLMLLAVGAQATTRYVPSQYSTIQAAINASLSGDTIVVAVGTYRESLNWVSKNLTILGAGAGRSIVNSRNPADNGPNGRCLYAKNLTAASRISGFTFTGGVGRGGGMLNDVSNPTVTNCTFTGNEAHYNGGGMHNAYSSPTITNCLFAGNKAATGGGMSNVSSNPRMTNCLFTGNSAFNGGGVYDEISSPTIANCVFTSNSAGNDFICSGGGMYNFNNSNPTITNCTFSGNTAVGALGGDGGGMYNFYSSPTITNCILWGNNPTGIDGSASVTYSDVQGLANTIPDAYGNFGADPLFLDAQNGLLHLKPGSPCHDRGNNAVLSSPPFLSVTGGILIDQATCRRLSGSRVDPGAYEFQSATDVSGQISVTKGTAYPDSTGAITQSVIIKNYGGTYLNGPISLVINGLTGYTLSNRTGVTSVFTLTGRPYINLPGGLAPGQSVSITLKFTKTGTATFSYTIQTMDGYGTR